MRKKKNKNPTRKKELKMNQLTLNTQEIDAFFYELFA